MSDGQDVMAQAGRLRLWNPNAAALWSVVFSPAFGAWLHAANWRALGQPARAKGSMMWVWGSLVFLVVAGGSAFVLPDAKWMDTAMRGAGIGILLGWYLTMGRQQIEFVKGSVGDYERRGWGMPLVIGVGSLAAFFAVVVGLGIWLDKPDAADLAGQMKPIIEAEWHKRPGLADAVVEKVTLEGKGGDKYSGEVEARIGGKEARFGLEVTVKDGAVAWETKGE